jgi:hypothetical protein
VKVELTNELVASAWQVLSARYGATVKDKASAYEMKQLARLMGLMGIMSPNRFLERTTTTLGLYIYPNFTPGDPESGRSLISQMRTLAHELRHVVQYKNDGRTFITDYLFYSARRAAYEAEAYKCNMEVQIGLVGEIPVGWPRKLADKLYSYHCNTRDVGFARRYLKLAESVTIRGGITKGPSKDVIDFAKEFNG